MIPDAARPGQGDRLSDLGVGHDYTHSESWITYRTFRQRYVQYDSFW